MPRIRFLENNGEGQINLIYIFCHIISNVKLIGKWTFDKLDVDEFTVSYEFEGEIPEGIEEPSVEKHYVNETGVEVAENPSVDGYTFSGWTTKDVEVTDGKFTMPGKDVKFVGTWTKNAPTEYTVTYYVDGRIYAQQTHSVDEVVNILTKPTRNGYIFDGWYSDEVNVSGRTFVMPDEDVDIWGVFHQEINIPIIDKGKIEISKVLSAPEGFTGKTSFTFQIWRADGYTEKLVKEINVKAGDSKTITVDVGNYYIYEIDAEEEGYNLTTACSANNNKVRVVGGRTSTVTFKNIYTEILNLETEDHFGYIIGYPDGTVRPEESITRAEVATIFFRMLTDESRDFYWSQENNFSDVNSDDWFNNAISTLANAGILIGYSDGTFRPNEPITRAELVKIAVSFYSSDAIGAEFSDTDGHWADVYINAAYALEFINGYGDGTFKPDQDIKRAEAMKIINRTLMRVPHEDHLLPDMITWEDNVEGMWYYAEVQEATNSHSYEWHDDYEIWTEILPIRDWTALEKKWSNAYSGN